MNTKKYFASGLAILLPIVLTIMIVNFLINFLTYPFLESTKTLLEHLPFFQHTHQITFLNIASKVLILFCLVSFIFLIGLLGKLFFINSLFQLGDYLLHKLPLINKIYKSCQDVVQSLFSSHSSKKFSQVVFVPFPHTNNLSLGLVTSESIQIENDNHPSDSFVSVFIPGTPNPSVGFMLMFKKEQLHFVNMKVDEAMKFIISCGVVMPDFEILKENHAKQTFNQDHILHSEGQLIQNTMNLHKSAGSF